MGKLEYLQKRLDSTLRENSHKGLHSGGIPACLYILVKYENYDTELTTVGKKFHRAAYVAVSQNEDGAIGKFPEHSTTSMYATVISCH